MRRSARHVKKLVVERDEAEDEASSEEEPEEDEEEAEEEIDEEVNMLAAYFLSASLA
jgi:hypothetical protein